MFYLIGGAGNGNFGDELILKAWLDYLAERGFRGEVVADENGSTAARKFFSSVHPSAKLSSDMTTLKQRGPNDYLESVRRGLNFFRNGGFSRHADLRHLEKTFEKVKVLHLHGGGFINTIWAHNAFFLGFGAAVKRHYGCKVVGTGLGILPAPGVSAESRKHLSEAVEGFDLIELRDRWSYDYLRSVSDAPSVLLGLDDSFMVRTVPHTSRQRTLHLSFFSSAEEMEDALAFAAGPQGKEFDRILFWACLNQDRACYERLVREVPRAQIAEWQALVKEPLPVSLGDFMITARFHPHLLSARHGASGMFRKDGGYYDVKHGSVVDLGSPFQPMVRGNEPSLEPPAFSAIQAFDEMRVCIKRRLADLIYSDML